MHNEEVNTDRELLRRVAKGDTQAYQHLFDTYWDQVYGAGLYLSKSPEQAKDLAQDIFLKLWDNRARLPEINNLAKYLYVITRNLFHDQLRTRIFQESNLDALRHYFGFSDSTPHERLEQKQLSHAVQDAINGLPGQLRQVFILSHFEKLSHAEIGQRLNITPFSSKTYMNRAMMTLRKLMGDNLEKLLIIIGLILRLLNF